MRKKAVTLVELLVVMRTIAVLIAMLLPALNKAREAAKKVACASNMRQIGQAIHMYANDNKGWMPPGYDNTINPVYTTPQYIFGNWTPTYNGLIFLLPYPWRFKYAPGTQGYLHNADVFFCPSDDWHNANRQDVTNADGVTYRGMATQPPGTDPSFISYDYLFFLPPGLNEGGTDTIFPDLVTGAPNGYPRYRIGEQDLRDGRTAAQTAILTDGGWPGSLYMNHKDGWNVLYMDGHVRFVPVPGSLGPYSSTWQSRIDYWDTY